MVLGRLSVLQSPVRVNVCLNAGYYRLLEIIRRVVLLSNVTVIRGRLPVCRTRVNLTSAEICRGDVTLRAMVRVVLNRSV